MNPPFGAREALLAEALGEAAHLLDRIDALAPELERTRQALQKSQLELTLRAEAFERQTQLLTETAKSKAAEHIARHTIEVTRQAAEAQTRTMAGAARRIFDEEIDKALQRLAATLRRAAADTDRPWEGWLVHIATAVASSAVTLVVVVYLQR